MEHRKLTKKEKWAIGGGAAVIALAVMVTLYEKHAQAAQNNSVPLGNAPSGGGGGNSSGATGDYNTTTSDQAAGTTSDQTAGSSDQGGASTSDGDAGAGG